jgi:hypothetical protein
MLDRMALRIEQWLVATAVVAAWGLSMSVVGSGAQIVLPIVAAILLAAAVGIPVGGTIVVRDHPPLSPGNPAAYRYGQALCAILIGVASIFAYGGAPDAGWGLALAVAAVTVLELTTEASAGGALQKALRG